MKTLSYLFIVLLFCLANTLSAWVKWDRTFGGISDDAGYSVQQTSDGGYIITGFTGYSYGAEDADLWLIKTDANGNKLWDKTFGGNFVDYGSSVQQTSDNGFIITGVTSSGYGSQYEDIWLIKTDADGNKLWDKTFGGANIQWGVSVQQTSDNGYIILGNIYFLGDIWLIKTDADGNKLWDKTFYSGGGSSIQQTRDGGYIIAGTIRYWLGSYEVWLIKTDANGNELWDSTFGEGVYDGAFCAQQTSDDGYIITGRTNFSVGFYDVFLIKTDPNGNQLWGKTFGGPYSDYGESVQQTSDGGYIITGHTGYSYGAEDAEVWLIKTDADGNMIWDETFGGAKEDFGSSVQQTSDKGYIITGYTESFGAGLYDVWLIYFKPDTHPPNPPTLLFPRDGSIIETLSFNMLWINNGDPDQDPVGSWLYMVGPWGQVISYDMGTYGFTVGVILSFPLTLFPGQEWAWTVYIYDPNHNSEPYYSFQDPFWTFFVID